MRKKKRVIFRTGSCFLLLCDGGEDRKKIYIYQGCTRCDNFSALVHEDKNRTALMGNKRLRKIKLKDADVSFSLSLVSDETRPHFSFFC